MKKLLEKVPGFVAECETAYGIQIAHGETITEHTLSRFNKELRRIQEKEKPRSSAPQIPIP